MGKVKLLLEVVGNLRSLADSLQAVADAVADKDDLLRWAEGELAEKAKLAYAGEGEFCAGEHCRFCKAKAVCRKRAEYNLELARYDFEMCEAAGLPGLVV